jgi:hypothetical protein
MRKLIVSEFITLTVGGGKRLFAAGVHAPFTLAKATPYPSGVVGLHCTRQRSSS